MALSKARKKAKAKRRMFKERIKMEQSQAKERKEIKSEIARRFSSGQSKMHLPEDDCCNYREKFKFDDYCTLEMLAKRMFFNKLENNLNNKECDSTHNLSKNLLSSMGLKNRTEEILSIFQEYGGYCDCEILSNIRDNMYMQYNEYYDDYYSNIDDFY